MSMKKILCLVLALVLCGAMAFAETDVQAQLDDANARIAELEALVELYKPFYDAQVVVEYDGGVVFLEDVLEEYAYYEEMYAQYGLDLVAYGYDAQVKQDAALSLLQSKVIMLKAEELGLTAMDEEAAAAMEAEIDSIYESYIDSITSQFTDQTVSDEDKRADAIAYLDSVGYTRESIEENMMMAYADDAVYSHITADIAVSEEEVQATYEQLLADAQTSYANDRTYNNARNGGETILWNPEGYRQVKHVLVMFSDEQSTLYTELTNTIDTLNAELEAILTPVETEETAEETTEETAEEAVEEVEVRTEEEVRADIAANEAELEALYAELLPRAQEVIDKFNGGAAFADLIAEYNEDPGMTNEPTASQGYAVAAASTTWDPRLHRGRDVH